MGKITINEFSDSLRNATIQVNEKLGDIEYKIGNQELKTDDKTITGAINELFQSANNGKELIATAIGEPLNAEDTFSAMSNDINGLLTTFKTNMMNNGVAVESSDKFKQLIDKIATMAEDNSGKGIHYAEGTIGDITFKSTEVSTFTIYNIPININFTPTIFFLEYTFHSNPNEGVMIINNIGNNIVSYGSTGTIDKDWSSFYIGNVSSTNCELYYRKGANSAYKFTNVKYYAIGVGEEDTALRDSLASILEDEGVEVTEEDNMASLITKVDEEFDRKNANKGVQFAEGTGEFTVPADGSNVTYNLNIDFDATLVIVRATSTYNELPSIVDRLKIVDSSIHNSFDTGCILVSGFSNVPICYIQGNTIIATSGMASNYSWNYTLSWIAIG